MKRIVGLLVEYVGIFVVFAVAVIGAALPLGAALWVYDTLNPFIPANPLWLMYALKGTLLGVCYYVYGFGLILWVPVLSIIVRARLKAWRGPYVSMGAFPWYLNAALVFMPRYSFLEFITPTVYNVWFYRLMGAKIGRGVQINSTAVCDPSLLEIGDYATIGGTASVMAHYAQGGYLVLSPVKIGAGATIGLRATIMGGTEVGDKAKVLANSFVLPNTKIPAGETWGGVPAKKIDIREFKQNARADAKADATALA